MSEFKKKTIEAAAKFLTCRGYDILDKSWESEGSRIDLVAQDGETIVFCDVDARKGTDKSMPVTSIEGSRERREIAAARWLEAQEGDEASDMQVRFDHIAMLTVSDDRALLRHHKDCLGYDALASSTD